MNRWATMLGDLPAGLQRAIARSQRISLPRRHDAAERLRRLRAALCHARTVQVTYDLLDHQEQAALQELRQLRGGISQDELARRYGAVRPATQLAADPHPQSLAERLVLLGWLLPRPAAPPRSRRFLLPPELRGWLPQPLLIATHGTVPALGLPLALRAAAALLVACAQRPLDARADGCLRRASLRVLARRLAPLNDDETAALCRFVLPLLAEMGALVRRGDIWELTPVASRFLAKPPAEQQARLREAWLGSPTPDAWLTPLVPSRSSIDLLVLRRRICIWVDALPAGELLAPDGLYGALAATFGPLADAHTHGWRFHPVERVPWQPRRAAAVFDAALRGPLRWLGLVGWAEDSAGGPGAPVSFVFRPAPEHALPADAGRPPWRYGAPGQVIIPHAAADADLLRLLPFVRWQAADADAATYQVTPATLAAAAGRGQSAGPLWALLDQRAGPAPDGWRAGLDGLDASVRIVHAAVALADPPAALDRVAEDRTVRRRIAARLAPGVALVEPADVAALTRALERRGVATLPEGKPAGAPASPLSPHESAALLLACAFYRRHAPPDAPLLPHDSLEERLRAELTSELRAALDTALDDLDAQLDRDLPPPVAPTELPTPMPLAQIARCLGQAIERGRAVELSYDTGGQGAWSLRVVRPLVLEWRYDELYLRAYCTLRQAERTFRVDRIGAVRVVGRSWKSASG